MMAALNTALSGLMASSTRMAVGANNIANMESTTSLKDGLLTNDSYRTQRIMQSSIAPSGGTRAMVEEKNPATVNRYDPENSAANAEGITEYPNTNLEDELVGNVMMAKYDFQANLKVIKAADEMLGNLLDIRA